jgi:alpha-beta hydrolase superfamily lysophospholipase
LPNDNRLLEDLAEMVDHTRSRMAPDLPLILLGHSLGGLVAARFVSLQMRPIEALVLSSPAFDAGLNAWQKLMLAVLPRYLPNLRVGNGLNPQWLSHDSQVVADYCADRLVHDRISARLGRFIADAGAATLAAAPTWSVPTLLLFGGADKLVNPEGSRRFASAAPREVLTSVCFETLYHEIFNEKDARPVLTALRHWLDQRS